MFILPRPIAWIVASVAILWVSLSTAIQFLLIFMALDYATGLIAGAIKKRLSSDKAWVGIGKKVLVLLLVTAAHVAARALNIGYDLGSLIATAYCVSELISITENCARAGIPVPSKLLELLEKARDAAWKGPERRIQEDPAYTGLYRRNSDTTGAEIASDGMKGKNGS